MNDAAELITDLRRRGFRVFIGDEGLFVTPRRNLDERDLDAIRQNKQELLAELWREENKELRAGLAEAERKLKSAEIFRSLYKMQVAMGEIVANELRADALRRRPAEGLDDGILKKALYLVHPDKHSGSEVANEVIVALQRIKERRGARP